MTCKKMDLDGCTVLLAPVPGCHVPVLGETRLPAVCRTSWHRAGGIGPAGSSYRDNTVVKSLGFGSRVCGKLLKVSCAPCVLGQCVAHGGIGECSA